MLREMIILLRRFFVIPMDLIFFTAAAVFFNELSSPCATHMKMSTKPRWKRKM